jgi:iron complex outermembrane receptor protein
MGPEFANGSNYRLQGSLKFSPDTDGFFKMGYHEMQNLPTGGYVQGVKATQESTFSGGTTTRFGDGKKLATNLFYENTTLIQQNITAATASANPYVSRIDKNPYNTLGGSVQYVQDLKDQVIDQFTTGVDIRTVEAINNGAVINSSGVATGAGFYAQGKQQFYGASGQVKSKLQSIPLQMTLSARVDQWMSQVPTYYVQSSTGAQTPTNSPNQSKTEFSPN